MSNYKFSLQSRERLSTCHVDLIVFGCELIKVTPYDIGITCGHRTVEEQFELFKKGRKLVGDKWQIVRHSKVVTYLDGYTKQSKHNPDPSLAFDIGVWHEGELSWWEPYYEQVGAVAMKLSDKLLKEKRILHEIEWGGNWKKFRDLPHYQLKAI